MRNGRGHDRRGRYVPPKSSHDVHAQLEDMRRWLSLDLDEMIAEGDVGPHTMITRTRTRFAEAVEALSGSGFGEGPRSLPPTAPGAPRDRYNAEESRYLMARDNVDELYLSVLNLNLHGNRVYHYTDAVVQWMLNTRINLPCEEFVLPFPALTMSTRSETMVRVFLGPKRQKLHRPGSSLAITVALRPPSEAGGTSHLSLITHLMDERGPVERTIAKIRLTPGLPIVEALGEYLRGVSHETHRPLQPEEEERIEGWFEDNAGNYYRTVLNCLLYLTTPNASVSEPYQTHNHDAGAGTRSRAPIHDVGREMAPLYVKPSDIFTLLKKGQKGAGSKLAWRVLVAGHWRSWPGQALSGDKSKRSWIKPFWRGDEANPIRNKPYVVIREDDR